MDQYYNVCQGWTLTQLPDQSLDPGIFFQEFLFFPMEPLCLFCIPRSQPPLACAAALLNQ